MVSKLSQVKNIVLEILSDGLEHTSDEMRSCIKEKGVDLEEKSGTLRTAIYQLRNNGTEIYSRDRGVYQIKEKNREEVYPILQGFTTLIPEKKVSPIYQLRNNGTEIYSRDRGVYQIKEKNREEVYPILQGFTTLIPEKKVSPTYVYVHADGSIILNGKLNKEIKSRQIEIRINNNGKKLALIPDGTDNHKFNKNGSTKNIGLLKALKSKRIGVPVTYVMELDKNSGIWIGEVYKNTSISTNCGRAGKRIADS